MKGVRERLPEVSVNNGLLACRAVPRPLSHTALLQALGFFVVLAVFSVSSLPPFIPWLVCAVLVKSARCILQQGEDSLPRNGNSDTEQGLRVLG